MSVSRARSLLERAALESVRLDRHLLVAAALTEVLATEPIVVGGLAQDWWAEDLYHQTDLDMCVPISREDQTMLRKLGLLREGRHWVHEPSNVAVEFPDSAIDGDPSRTILVDVGGGHARIIGIEDLYLDRIRQATVDETAERTPAFAGAIVLAAARYEEMDWDYVDSRVRAAVKDERLVGEPMRRINRRVRPRARRAAAGP